MARITVEDCLTQVDNRFSLVHLAARRVRQIKKGDPPRIQCKNREAVTALREIAAGFVTPEWLKEIEESFARRYEPKLPSVSADAQQAESAEEIPPVPEAAETTEAAEESDFVSEETGDEEGNEASDEENE